MAPLRFAWDPRKDRANRRKHGISFPEASTVFADDRALVAADPDHSDREDRFLILGFSVAARVLLVCFCERGRRNLIRIISARKATRAERGRYAHGRMP